MFACVSHWYMSGLYLVPVAGLVGFLKLSSWRQRRSERTSASSERTSALPAQR
jgi:hypothetical protein